MTATLHCSPPAPPPLEVDDLLAEILLRLPPQPSSLPRASAVSRRWRSLASDPRFCGRFRAHHRRNPPLLGCFVKDFGQIHFKPALEAPDRIPQGRFSFPMGGFRPLGCRHGLVLSFNYGRNQLRVWDPVFGDQHLLDVPGGFDTEENWINAAVFRANGDARDFQVVFVGPSVQQKQVIASVYSSKTGIWGNLTTAPVPPGFVHMDVYPDMPAVMVGDSLYWLLTGYTFGILEFDLGRQSLGMMIPLPGEEIIRDDMGLGDIWVVMAEGGGLGFLLVSGFNAQLWKRKMDCDGAASWALQRTIALDKLLSINSEKETESPSISGFAEDNDVVLLSTSIGVFTVQLESLQFKKLFESPDSEKMDVFQFKNRESYYPFEWVYTPDKGIDGGHDGAELLQKK